MSMSVAVPISLEQYFAEPTKPASEYLHGELIQKAMPTKLHALLQVWISYLLLKSLNFAKDRVATEQNVQLAENFVLVPDVCVFRANPHESGSAVTDPPLLCVEILSPSDRFSSTTKKCQDYLRWGVSACWILDPESQQAWIVSLTKIELVPEGGSLEAGEISLGLAEIFQPK